MICIPGTLLRSRCPQVVSWIDKLMLSGLSFGTCDIHCLDIGSLWAMFLSPAMVTLVYWARPCFAAKHSAIGGGARAGAADTRREESLADVISMHSVVVELGITNNLAATYHLRIIVYTCGRDALGSDDGVCALSVDSVARLSKEHRYRLWESSGKATGLYWQLTCVVEEDWYEISWYHSSRCCLHDLLKLHTDSSGNSKQTAIWTAL